jgi:hypothetical protein
MQKVNETECTFEVNGQKFTNRGAYVDDNFADVYVTRNEKDRQALAGSTIKVTDWHGNKLGAGVILKEWRLRNYTRMVSVRFIIDGVVYSGRFNYDTGQLVRGKKVKG